MIINMLYINYIENETKYKTLKYIQLYMVS